MLTDSMRFTRPSPADIHSSDAMGWRRFESAQQEQHSSLAEVCDQPLVTRSLDRHTGVWILCVSNTGEAILRLNHRIVGILPAKDGVAILRTGGCPFECAATFIAALNAILAPAMSDTTRTDFEFDMARWIPRYFEV